MEEVKLRSLLIKRLKTASTGAQIALENKKFDPPQNGYWVEPFFLPDDKGSCGKLPVDSDELGGIFQVNVFGPLYVGTRKQYTIAQEIIKVFQHGLQLLDTGIKIHIESAELEPSFRSGAHWQTPISINYTAYTARH